MLYTKHDLEHAKIMVLPSLLSNSQVAAKLGITRQNMPHQRKSKGFPEPVLIVDKFPMWLESDITCWIESKKK